MTGQRAPGPAVMAPDQVWQVIGAQRLSLAGEGPQVSGPIRAILLVCTGRLRALPQLAGGGAHSLAARLSPPAPR